jgi:hypothetical protein
MNIVHDNIAPQITEAKAAIAELSAERTERGGISDLPNPLRRELKAVNSMPRQRASGDES